MDEIHRETTNQTANRGWSKWEHVEQYHRSITSYLILHNICNVMWYVK